MKTTVLMLATMIASFFSYGEKLTTMEDGSTSLVDYGCGCGKGKGGDKGGNTGADKEVK